MPERRAQPPEPGQRLRELVRGLAGAYDGHLAWLADWHRHLVCRLPPEPDQVSDEAHAACGFGRWFTDGGRRAVAAELGAAVAERVDTRHRVMHARALRLSERVRVGRPVTPTGYAACAEAVRRFAREVLALERRVRDRLGDLDPLTGVWSRQHMLDAIERERQRARRSRRPASLGMVDVDHFKHINDHHGHPAGDAILRALVRHLRRALRPYDLIHRYAGDEFVICLPEVDAAAAAQVLDRARRRLATVELTAGGRPVRVTISAGVCELSELPSAVAAVARADQALYRAKRAGRDRVCVAGRPRSR